MTVHECLIDGCDRRAPDGFWLCGPDTQQLARDAIDAAKLHHDMALVLTATSRIGEKTSGSRSYGLDLNDRAAAARTAIRNSLTTWARHVDQEAPQTALRSPLSHERTEVDVWDAGRYVAAYAGWLAGQTYADEPAVELRSLVRASWTVAYPDGTYIVRIDCPVVGCEAQIRALLHTTDTLLPSELACWNNHTWPADRWRELNRAVNESLERQSA